MTLRERFDPLVRRLSGGRLYLAYTLDEAEFIGRVNRVQELREIGFEPVPRVAGVPLSAAKRHPVDGEVHEYTLRMVDPENERKQYHVHLWDLFSLAGAEIAIHHEYRPDFRPVADESLTEMYERLQTHYRPSYGDTYLQGEAPTELLEIVESQP